MEPLLSYRSIYAGSRLRNAEGPGPETGALLVVDLGSGQLELMSVRYYRRHSLTLLELTTRSFPLLVPS